MTNPGLYADLHQQMRELADLVDRVLVGLRDAEVENANRNKLAQTLSDLAEPNPDDLSIRLLAISLGSGQGNRQKWRQISEALRGVQPNPAVFDDLEQFAQLLEQRQADALAKMRGWM